MMSNDHMIAVVMDGIKDANMLCIYAEMAESEGDSNAQQWFHKKAGERSRQTETEWHEVKSVLKLDESKDSASMCLMNHIEHELSTLMVKTKA